jgi:DNA repair protein RadA/Sms
VAVLGRRAGVSIGADDLYASLAGGLSVTEPALDLPLALAIASSKRDRPIDPATVACGEIGLLGELRQVAGLDRRLREAARLGFGRAIVPAAGPQPAQLDGRLEVVRVSSLREALKVALGDARASGQAAGTEVGRPVMEVRT